jgi:hypothetical protein
MALQRIGQLQRFIEGAEKDASDEIDEIQSKLVDQKGKFYYECKAEEVKT